ncbi:spc97 like protein [Mucor ambiguus]|uniref:Spindle pole body component n=1 Tax=Mucor ambiguus TaxID=91626 RepID=A0A0C9MQM1_9FUNG|nr:spc97 like protein [Mucor ambiguus]
MASSSSAPIHSDSTIASNNYPATSTASKSVLLSENQLSKISKNLANIRGGSVPALNTSMIDAEASFQSSPISMNPPSGQASSDSAPQEAVGDLSVQIQEYAVIEDLLYVLIVSVALLTDEPMTLRIFIQGIDGSYIKCNYPKALLDDDDLMEDIHSHYPQQQGENSWDAMRYIIDPTLDPSLKHLVEKILPLATYYMSISAFIDQFSRFEYGTINHALCAAMRVYTKEYLTFVAQLEHEFQTSTSFTLQRLWFYAQELLQSMKILHNLAMTIRSIKISKATEDEDDDIEAVIEGLQKDKSNEEVHISENQKGGAILNILSERLIGLSGDPKCKKIYTKLLSKASVPYFEILNFWIYHGEIKDSYNEFMVLEKRSVKKENLKEDYNDTYWETRYTIREGSVPVFLEPMKNQILLAGKFLNVVRECGVRIANPQEMQSEILGQNIDQDLSLNSPLANKPQHSTSNSSIMPTRSEVWAAVDGSRFVKSLDIAYRYANQTLLNLLLKDQQLIERLRSLKHYFFLDQSDFLTSFLDLAKDELKQLSSDISQTRLQSLMDLVLRNPSSVAAYDPFKEDVKVSMSHLRLIDQLLRIISVSGMESASSNTRLSTLNSSAGGLASSSGSGVFERGQSLSNSIMSTSSIAATTSKEPLSGYEALILDYTVTFPLSLVISRKALTKYQLLFRHILNMKHVEDLLCSTWMDQKNALWKGRSGNPEIDHLKFRIFSLRNRMLTFVQQFAYYVTNEVLEPNWRRLEANLKNITTVDQVLQYHSDFLDTCLKECMLTHSKLLRIFNKLISSCMAFTTQAEKYSHLLNSLENSQTVDRFGVPISGLHDSAQAMYDIANRSLSRLEDSFLYHMKLLIDALNFYSAQETVQYLCLVVRLDYNQFYSNAPMTRDTSSGRQK